MENNDSLKPQSVGGLKLMTVFVVVLALHVVVIGSICTYYLLKGGNSDADALADKIHKNLTPTPENMTSTDSSTTPDTSDKTTPLPANPTDTAGTTPAPVDNTMVVSDNSSIITPPATPSTPAAPTDPTATPAPASTTATTPDSSASAQVASVTPVASTTSTTVPAAINNLAPPADPAPAPTPAPTAASAPVVAATVTTASTANTPYVVKQGDVLEKIAHRNHISVAKLKAANSLSSDFLHIGQKLVIPAATSDTAVAATTPAPEAPIAKTAPVASVKTSAPKTTANFTQKKNKTGIAATSSKPGYYTVVKGDNLTKIAHKFKITPNAIMTANNISDPKKLSIGEKLKIPSKEARSANAAPVTAHATQLANVTQ